MTFPLSQIKFAIFFFRKKKDTDQGSGGPSARPGQDHDHGGTQFVVSSCVEWRHLSSWPLYLVWMMKVAIILSRAQYTPFSPAESQVGRWKKIVEMLGHITTTTRWKCAPVYWYLPWLGPWVSSGDLSPPGMTSGKGASCRIGTNCMMVWPWM